MGDWGIGEGCGRGIGELGEGELGGGVEGGIGGVSERGEWGREGEGGVSEGDWRRE